MSDRIILEYEKILKKVEFKGHPSSSPFDKYKDALFNKYHKLTLKLKDGTKKIVIKMLSY